MIGPPRRIAAAVTGTGIALCILGWYQIAGQPTVPQQLPYLASATIPGAALLAVGLGLLLRAPLTRTADRPGSDAPDSPDAPGSANGNVSAALPGSGLWRVPDGRYLHGADCPLLDGRTDLLAASAPPADGAESAGEPAGFAEPAGLERPGGLAAALLPGPLRPCPLCRAGAAADPR